MLPVGGTGRGSSGRPVRQIEVSRGSAAASDRFLPFGGGEEERKFWRRTMEEGEQTGEDFGRAVVLMERHGAIQDTLERARHYGAMARDSLAIFPVCAEKKGLLDVIDFCIRRAH